MLTFLLICVLFGYIGQFDAEIVTVSIWDEEFKFNTSALINEKAEEEW